MDALNIMLQDLVASFILLIQHFAVFYKIILFVQQIFVNTFLSIVVPVYLKVFNLNFFPLSFYRLLIRICVTLLTIAKTNVTDL